jgi:hypothetical protein
MKASSFAIALSSILPAATKAVLGPGYEDVMYCPPGNCEIYLNPFGYAGPASLFNKCYDPETGTITNAVWTGSLTNVTAPDGWVTPEVCTAEQYSQCNTADDCTLKVGPTCDCYVSSNLQPFDAESGLRQAVCTGNECDGYTAVCQPGMDSGNTCMVEFPVTLPSVTSTSTGATEPASSGVTTTTTTTTAAPVDGTDNIDTTDEKQTDTPVGPVASGSITGVSIFVSAAAVLAYFS